MMEIYLVVIQIASGASSPNIAYIKQPSLAACWQAAAAHVEADKAKSSASLPQLGAGCEIVFAPIGR